MPTLMLAYDTEHSNCLEGVRQIVRVHEKYDFPGTFFIVARLLEKQGEEYRSLLRNHPLFEIASHSMTHMLLMDHRICGKAGPEERFSDEIVTSKERLEEHFGCQVQGFRSPVGWPDGLKGAPRLLALIREAGYTYTSCTAWGAATTLPAPIRGVFTYDADGYPDILEIPGHGWHENVAKGNTAIDLDKLQPPDPHPLPELKLTRPLANPEEEIALNRTLMETGLARKAPYVTPIWHPWSLHRFDPKMRMIEGVIQAGRGLGFGGSTFDQLAQQCLETSTV